MKSSPKFTICAPVFNMHLLNIYVLEWKEPLNSLTERNSFRKQTEHWRVKIYYNMQLGIHFKK